MFKIHLSINNIVNNADFILLARNNQLCSDWCWSRWSSSNFKPFTVDQVDDNKFLLNESDLDPNINLCNNYALPDSLYVTSTDLNDFHSGIDHSDCFSILHVNCRSIHKNYNNLLTTINIVSPPIPIIAVSEIWTHEENEDLFGLPGYNLVVK